LALAAALALVVFGAEDIYLLLFIHII